MAHVLQQVQRNIKNIRYIFSDLRRQHREIITSEDIEMSEVEKAVRLHMKVSFFNFGLVTFALLVYYPLLLIAAPLYVYTVGAIYRDALQSLIKHHRATPSLLSALAATGFIIGGMFFTAALEVWISSIVRYLVIKTEDHSKHSLSSLFGKQSNSLWIVKEGDEIQIPLEQVQTNDIAVVGAGEMILVDGTIIDGIASIDQHKLTGESQLAEKTNGDNALASTVVISGKIYIQVEKTGEKTVAAQIGRILNQTTDFKEVIQSRSDIQSSKWILPMLGMSALAFPIGGINSSTAIFMNVPAYKMRYFGPISMLNFLNIAAQQGILIKDGRSLELLRDIDTVVFDKTGTLTIDQLQVHKIYSCSYSSDEILIFAATAENRQNHPIARAILAEANSRQLKLLSIEDIHYELGHGIKVRIGEQIVWVGSDRFMEMENISIPDEICQFPSSDHPEGYSLVMVAIDNELVGAIELQPTLRPEAEGIICHLHELQLEVVIISGDNEKPTQNLAKKLGIDRYFAEVLPEDKANLVEKLQQEGHSVCFVGDGINDAIALKKANVSVSLKGATTLATDTAQIVLMDGKLSKLTALFELSQEFEETQKTNLIISTYPAFFCIGGIFLLGWSALTAVIITETVFFVGFVNSMLPLFRHINQESQQS
jgi:heavy metal translocating P-type ATPase